MHRLFKNASALTGMAMIAVVPALAQTPQQTTARYDDWMVSCAIAAGVKSCEMSQSQSIQGQATPVSQITIGRVAKNEPLKIAFQVAPDLWLQAGLKLIIDEKEAPLAAMFRWCVPTRCLADADLTDAITKKLAGRTEPVRLLWKDASQRDITIPVSLNGFLPALNAMNETSTPGPAADDVRRFDGQWLLESECQAISPSVLKSAWKTTGKISNGQLSAKFGDEGKPGSGKFEGVVKPNGSLELSVTGLSGDSKYNTNNVPEKTPYNWKASGNLSGSDGTATKIEGRFCHVSFSKSS
ncbi:Invasion protein IalB, involved in pathogenesis [Bradyrhizobium lablabi]|uniref:Invasion protein IalB, involved in pathogenesis n=1 Tax=Bradyrhizobium lablabi TaxID=722472 RepID=A0A1M6XRI0_9BRAD|nr:invasion associated locus B family protein [Bradyrhizobium lablabi]SHL08597.1 Invasion protein IalB, involved in pathogenesis [Bradyrhizobium lablabi]